MKIITAAVLLLSLLAPRALAESVSLKGLPRALGIVIEPLDPDAHKAGLTETALEKVILSRFAKRHVAFTQQPAAEVYSRVVVLTSYDVNNKVLGYGAHIELSCREKAVLKRDPTFEFMAPVWFKGNVTVSNPKAFTSDVVKALADLTDQFITDYQRANPGR